MPWRLLITNQYFSVSEKQMAIQSIITSIFVHELVTQDLPLSSQAIISNSWLIAEGSANVHNIISRQIWLEVDQFTAALDYFDTFNRSP